VRIKINNLFENIHNANKLICKNQINLLNLSTLFKLKIISNKIILNEK
jgi:hypothetical protein